MNVMRFAHDTLHADPAPIPQPGAREVLIRVHASGVTPTELQWYPTTHTSAGAPRSGAIPGHEFSGIVEAVGEGTDPSLVGRAVFGMNDWFAEGSTADYCTAPADFIAEIARLLDVGELKSCLAAIAPFAHAADAYRGAVPRLAPGKVVLALGE